MEKLKELRQNLAALDEKAKQAKADMTEKEDENAYLFDYLFQSISYMREYMYQLEDQLWQHSSPSNGHLPKIKGAGKMESALKTLGLNDDYDVQKPTIYASASRSGNKQFEVTLPSLKK